MDKKASITPKTAGKWFGLVVLALGILWTALAFANQNTVSAGIGIVITILGILVIIVARKLL